MLSGTAVTFGYSFAQCDKAQAVHINRTLYNTFMCFKRECDYMILLRTYSCTTTDSIGRLKGNVREHYNSICAAREVTGWLIVFLCFLC